MSKKTAIITGVAGQDGSFLSEYLLGLGYHVIGTYRRVSTGNNFSNIREALKHPEFEIVEGSITDAAFMTELISTRKPDEFYNLAAASHVGSSFSNVLDTLRTNGEAVAIQLEIIRNFSPSTRYYQACTSEMFGGLSCPVEGYSENSDFDPQSPYAAAKVYSFNIVKIYRKAYGLFAASGILHNHSSCRRGYDFALRKITRGVANIVAGKQKTIKMGDISPFRDESHSRDCVRAMWLMLQQDKPDDYLVASGEGATIKEMLEYVCGLAGLQYENVYEMDKEFMRPAEVKYLLGDPSKIKKLGWVPEYNLQGIMKEMYEYDLALAMKTQD